MITYRTVHTGPKSQEGGAKKGFLRVEYQRVVEEGIRRV